MSVNMQTTLRDLRIEAGLTAMELAYKAGVSVPTIYRMENGTAAVSRLIANKVLNTLGRELERKITLDSVEGIRLLEK